MLNCSSIWGQFDQVKLQSRYNKFIIINICFLILIFTPGDPPTSFFNASVISFTDTNQQFLAAMVPNPNSIENFWQMIIEKKVFIIISCEPTSYIWLHQVSIIVILLGIEDTTKRKEKQYWPNEDSGILHLGNKINIEHLSTCTHSTFVSR